jgi:hydrogenase 3 maturation protease
MAEKKISPSSWQKPLLDALAQPARTDSSSSLAAPRLALVGIGSELNGDDIAGVRIARLLIPRLAGSRKVLVIDAGLAPENFTGVLRRFAPSLVILLDAAQMDEPPGTVRWLAWQAAGGLSASTHTQPPSTLAQYLIAELGCQVALLGIQPASLEPGSPLSPQVRKTISRIVKYFSNLL